MVTDTSTNLEFWTVYDDPIDLPGQFMVRRFDITSASSQLARPLSKSGSASTVRVTSGWRPNPVTIW